MAKNTTNNITTVNMILGDQLDQDSLIFNDVEKSNALFFMAEVLAESKPQEINQKTLGAHSSKQRTVLFLSAMRHFKLYLLSQDYTVEYFDISQKYPSFSKSLDTLLEQSKFKTLRCVLPGDERVRLELKAWCKSNNIEFEVLADQHFITQKGAFKKWIKDKKQPRMEYWYRQLRKECQILLDDKGKPVGGKWNYDGDNRQSFGKEGPKDLPENIKFEHHKDDIYTQVIKDVEEHLPDLYGNLKEFNWPLNRQQALTQLDDFIKNRLQCFGDYQDAMWQDQAFLFHSLLSSSLNLKLLNPIEVIQAAEKAYKDNKVPLNAVEGFIRQILGWREYVRGLYWLQKDDWLDMNFLQAQNKLPNFYWHAKTDMNCMAQSLSQVVDYGYGHHIQRLMVTGLFSLIYGVKPQEIEQWYLAMYVDAIAWVEQPNTFAMSQYADGGFLASKPYIASGNYINRMSNYCKHCKYKYNQASGEKACPFTTFYWDFVNQHQDHLSQNPRLGMQVKNWLNKSTEEQKQISEHATYLRRKISHQD